jgi:hypothetical protein
MHCWACAIREPGRGKQCLQSRVDEFAPHADGVGLGRGNPWVHGASPSSLRDHDRRTITGHGLARFPARRDPATYALLCGQEMGSPGRLGARREGVHQGDQRDKRVDQQPGSCIASRCRLFRADGGPPRSICCHLRLRGLSWRPWPEVSAPLHCQIGVVGVGHVSCALKRQ